MIAKLPSILGNILAGCGLDDEIGDALPHVGGLQCLHDIGVELVEDRHGRACGRARPVPRWDKVVRDAKIPRQ